MGETLTRTICIKLDVDGHEQALQGTQLHFNAAASWIASVCWDERITNTNTAHHRVYGETRTRFGLGAQLAVCARAKAMEAIKAIKTQEKQRRGHQCKNRPPPKPATCPQFGPRGSVRYDARTYHLLWGKRQHEILVDPQWEIGSTDLV